MKPEEMRDDIPEDVREALARAMHGPGAWVNLQAELRNTIRPKPRTVRLPAADLPAPLKEVPEDGWAWVLAQDMPGGIRKATGSALKSAISHGSAWATEADAEAWLAHIQSWRNPRPGADWTPHTPGDPMPCDGEALVDVRFRDGYVSRSDHADHYSWQRLDEDRPHDFDITAWRYAREEA